MTRVYMPPRADIPFNKPLNCFVERLWLELIDRTVGRARLILVDLKKICGLSKSRLTLADLRHSPEMIAEATGKR